MPERTRRLQRRRRGEILSVGELQLLASRGDISGLIVHALDLSDVSDLDTANVEGTFFLGCDFASHEQEGDLVRRGACTLPPFRGLPYDPYRSKLYSVEELMEGWEEDGYTGTRDFRIFAHYDRERRNPDGADLRESFAQRVHDHGIDAGLEELLALHSGTGVVGIMGGHGTKRSDPYFAKVARLTWELAREGYLVATGGGPGIMEAGNLGAFFSNYADPAVLDEVIAELSGADKFDGGEEEGTPEYLEAIRAYFRCGQQVLARFGAEAEGEIVERYRRERSEPGRSLAVPTWFYGHEPSNLFSTDIAKYFSNSLREDGLLAIATAGVIYAPGSAGTLQEVFMDLAQNHYATFKFRSPMIFLGVERYSILVEMLQGFVSRRGMSEVYGDLITLTDDPLEAVRFVRENPPREREEKTPLYELLG